MPSYGNNVDIKVIILGECMYPATAFRRNVPKAYCVHCMYKHSNFRSVAQAHLGL